MTYTWSPNSSLSASTGSVVTATPASTTTYTVTASNTNCSATDSVTITINPSPIASFTSDTACYSSPTHFTDHSTVSAGNITNWNWKFGDPSSGTSTVRNTTYIYDTAGNYNTTLVVTSNFGCVDSVTSTVIVYPIPTVTITGDSIICAGSSTTLYGNGASSYVWNPNPTGTPGQSFLVSPASTSTYTVVGTNNYGCGNTARRVVTVTPSNGFDLAGNLSVCIDTPSFSLASIQACIFNNRCQMTNGTLKLVLDTALHITNIVSDSAAHISGDTLIWNFDSLSDITSMHCVSLNGTVSNIPAGDSVFVTMIITPTAGDSVPSNNSVTYWVRSFPYNCVGIPFDPNEKSVSPVGNISPTQQLTYTIEFQNTGTAIAHNIVVIDTLNQYVDPTTLKVISSSSKQVTSVVSGNIVKFTFNGINLPDTATSKTTSIGIIKYTISPTANAAPGNVIKNTAGIYFDANPVVLTNTTTSVITGSPTLLQNISTALHVAAFPNPFTTTTSIVFNTGGTHYLEVDDVTGRKLESMECSGRQYELSRKNLAEGIYFIKAYDAEHKYMAVQKIVLE